ncbi:winged helix-turn-helix domain-containing protein [Vibrio campbellii]|uniref:winged helix-turn-helix domain-containing protein n=1 Tax=Vibrio campbellii TaxID=680 RepID=UPI003F844795
MDVKFDSSGSRIFYRQKSVFLQPNELNLALLLLKNKGDIVSKEEILQTVWKDKVVTEGSIKRSISLLRKSISEIGANVEIIAHRGLGYSLNTPLNVFVDGSFIKLDNIESVASGTFSFFKLKAQTIILLLIAFNLSASAYFLFDHLFKPGLSQTKPYLEEMLISPSYEVVTTHEEEVASVKLIYAKRDHVPQYLWSALESINENMVVFYSQEEGEVYFSLFINNSSSKKYAHNYTLSIDTADEKIKEILSQFK